MKTRNRRSWLAVAAISLSLGAAYGDDTDDQILASFDREFNREPIPSRPVQRESVAEDPLYELINSMLWTESPIVDPVPDSLLRDQFHEPVVSSITTIVDEPDRLTETFNDLLWTFN